MDGLDYLGKLELLVSVVYLVKMESLENRV